MIYTSQGALISKCGRYRDRLWRRWDDQRPVLLVCMLNPSTANGEEDDPTIRRVVGFAERMGYGGIEIVNLFTLRSKNPTDLLAVPFHDAVGPQANATLHAVLSFYGVDLVCAWGTDVLRKGLAIRQQQVLDMVDALGGVPRAFALSKNGTPRHPLYLPYSDQLINMSW